MEGHVQSNRLVSADPFSIVVSPNIDISEGIHRLSEQRQPDEPDTPYTADVFPILSSIQISPGKKTVGGPAAQVSSYPDKRAHKSAIAPTGQGQRPVNRKVHGTETCTKYQVNGPLYPIYAPTRPNYPS